MSDSQYWALAFWSIAMIALGAGIARSASVDDFQKKAVAANVAHYEIDSKTGKSMFILSCPVTK